MPTQNYIPAVAIGAGALVAVYLLSRNQGGGRAPIVSNALIPTSQPGQPIDRDPARVAGFSQLANVALGSQRLQEQSSSIAANLELGRFRLQEQSAVIQAGLQQGLSAQQNQLELERIRQQGVQNRLQAEIADRAFDRELQAKALDQTLALAQQGQIQQGISGLLAALLGALRPQQQRPQQRPSSGGAGGAGTPQQQRPQFRFPRIPSPNIGPFTPPFIPAFPDLRELPGFSGIAYEPPFDPFTGLLYDPGTGGFPEFGYGDLYGLFGDYGYGGGESNLPELSFPGDPGYIEPGFFGNDYFDPYNLPDYFGYDYFLTDPFDFNFGYGGGGGGGYDFADFAFEDYYA